jgi:hypothetical protein
MSTAPKKIIVAYHKQTLRHEMVGHIKHLEKAIRDLSYPEPLLLDFSENFSEIQSKAKECLNGNSTDFAVILYSREAPTYLSPTDSYDALKAQIEQQPDTRRHQGVKKYSLLKELNIFDFEEGHGTSLLILGCDPQASEGHTNTPWSKKRITFIPYNHWFKRIDKPSLNFSCALQLAFDPYRYRNGVSSQRDLMTELLFEKNTTTTTAGTACYENLDPLKESLNKHLIDEVGLDEECRTAFLRLLKSVADSRPFLAGLIGWSFTFNVIRAMTMARRLSSWSLEGEKFNCWIKLVDASDVVEGMFSNAHRLFGSCSNIHFDISHEKEVREIAEMAIGDSVFLHVDWNTNRIQSVYSHKTVYSDNPMKDTCPKDKSYIAIHVRSDERVEIFDKDGRNVLIWDGFRWRPNPVHDLEKQLSEFQFSNTCDKLKLQSTLKDTGARLLDGGYSSIFILVHADDRKEYDPIWGETLRSDLLPPKGLFKPLDITKIGDSALFTLLKLDGAHFISSEGRLFKICGSLTSPSDAWHECLLSQKELDGCQINRDKEVQLGIHGSVKCHDNSLLIYSKGEFNQFAKELKKFILGDGATDGSWWQSALMRSLGLLHHESKLFLDIRVKDSLLVQPTANHNFAPNEPYCKVVQDGDRLYKRFRVLVDIEYIEKTKEILKDSCWEYAPATLQLISQWSRSGHLSVMGNSGTGTRAAIATSKKMPNSLVVKVSASGKIIVFKNGKPAS